MNLSEKNGESKVSKRPTFCLDCEQWFEPKGEFSDRCERCAPPKGSETQDSQVQQKQEPKDLPSNVIAVDFGRRK